MTDAELSHGLRVESGQDNKSEKSSKKGGFLKRFVVGLILVMLGIACVVAGVLFFSQEKVAVVSPDKPESGNNGDLVYLTGNLSSSKLTDPMFGLEVDAIKLKRIVEVYQWNKVGSTYQKIWSDKLIKTNIPEAEKGIVNPTKILISSAEWPQGDAKIRVGEFSLSDKMEKEVSSFSKLKLEPDNFSKLDEEGKAAFKLYDGMFYYSVEPGDPEVGDFRVSYEEIKGGQVTILAKQNGSILSSYESELNGSIEKIRYGTYSLDSMAVGKDITAGTPLSNYFYGVGGLVVLFGLFTVLSSFKVVKKARDSKLAADDNDSDDDMDFESELDDEYEEYTGIDDEIEEEAKSRDDNSMSEPDFIKPSEGNIDDNFGADEHNMLNENSYKGTEVVSGLPENPEIRGYGREGGQSYSDDLSKALDFNSDNLSGDGPLHGVYPDTLPEGVEFIQPGSLSGHVPPKKEENSYEEFNSVPVEVDIPPQISSSPNVDMPEGVEVIEPGSLSARPVAKVDEGLNEPKMMETSGFKPMGGDMEAGDLAGHSFENSEYPDAPGFPEFHEAGVAVSDFQPPELASFESYDEKNTGEQPAFGENMPENNGQGFIHDDMSDNIPPEPKEQVFLAPGVPYEPDYDIAKKAREEAEKEANFTSLLPDEAKEY